MMFDHLGNLYVTKNDDTYQINIDNKESLTFDRTKYEKHEKITPTPIKSNAHMINKSLKEIIFSADLENDVESDYLDYNTIGSLYDNVNIMNNECRNDFFDDDIFDFYGDYDVDIYETDENISSLYETIFYNGDTILFRSKLNTRPIYRLYVDLTNNDVFLKSFGTVPKQFKLL